MRLEDILKEVIDEKLANKHKFLWIVDELGISQRHIPNIYPELSIHFYDNPVDFRLFYEPLRERMEEDKPANAIVVSPKESDIPPDVRRYCPLPLHLRPSVLFKKLNPIVDNLLVEGKLVEKLAIFYDGFPRGREETIRFVLQNLLEIPPLPPTPSLSDAFRLLQAYHLRGEGFPKDFLKPYLAPLGKIGHPFEELLVKRENFEELLKGLLLAWLEKNAGVELAGVEDRTRELLNAGISLEKNELLEGAWKRIDWEEIARKIPLNSVRSLISPLLPQDFYQSLSKVLRQELCRSWRDDSIFKPADILRRERKATEELEKTLNLVEFIRNFLLPAGEEPHKLALEWQELARRIAFQWRNIDGLEGGSALYREWKKRLEQANEEFVKFVLQNYPRWIGAKPRPILSCDVLSEAVLPHLKRGIPVYLLVIDGMTYSQWVMIEDEIRKEMVGYKFEDKKCFAILPSTTIYSRNAIFAGQLPREIAKRYGEYYLYNNEREKDMLEDWLRRNLPGKKFAYCKLREDWKGALEEKADLKAFILNFADEISHLTGKVADSEEELLALVKTAYRYRPFSELLSAVKRDRAVLVITSDHGSIWVSETYQIPQKEHEESLVRSSRFYRLGDNLSEGERKSLNILKMHYVQYLSKGTAEEWGLPAGNYLLAYGKAMFSEKRQIPKMAVHGGISLWEMCVPLVVFTPKNLYSP